MYLTTKKTKAILLATLTHILIIWFQWISYKTNKQLTKMKVRLPDNKVRLKECVWILLFSIVIVHVQYSTPFLPSILHVRKVSSYWKLCYFDNAFTMTDVFQLLLVTHKHCFKASILTNYCDQMSQIIQDSPGFMSFMCPNISQKNNNNKK